MYQKIKNENIKEKCFAYLGGKICAKCKTLSLPFPCYEFHHIRGNKKENISAMLNKSWQEIKAELDKCVVVCANCHREIHYYNIKIR